MSKRSSIHLLTAAAAALTLTLTSGVAGAASTSPAAAGRAKLRVVTIVMHDPGCHWFSVAGKNRARLVVSGKTAVRNLDEAALVFTGKGYARRLAVGKNLAIAKRGVYRIKMVGQHPTDNTLTLVVR